MKIRYCPIIDDLKGFERDTTLYTSFKEKLITSEITTLYGELKDVQLPFDETGDNITLQIESNGENAKKKRRVSYGQGRKYCD